MLNDEALARIEAIVEGAGIAGPIEALLPTGGRPRQLSVRTLIVGMCGAHTDGRPAHLTRVHDVLVGLDDTNRRRLGVTVEWRGGPHTLTYRQVERTFGLMASALGRDRAPGEPSGALNAVVDALMEASIPAPYKGASTSLAIDWTDHESFACPPATPGGASFDPDASWGHRRANSPGQRDELFYGYYPQAATMVADEGGPAVPELARRLLVTSCHVDPPRAFVDVLTRMVGAGIALGDVLADSGYAHRAAAAWALPLRALGARLVQDHHPHDRGPKGTHAGAIIANGNLYCPCTPPALLDIGPLPRGADALSAEAHDTATTEAARYKLGRHSADDADGYHRVGCPAVAGKLRCPLRPASMSLALDRPEIVNPPEEPPMCCAQRSVTVPPAVAAKTAQKHDYPGAQWRRSYGRRSAAERTFATIKDPASTNTTRGWSRVTGLTAITLLLTCALVVRNGRIIAAFEARRADDERREANGQPPRVRRRRRRTLADLADP